MIAWVMVGVLVHLTTEEAAAVRTFLADDLCALFELRVVDEQCSTFTRNDVLRFVEALRGEVAERPQRLPMEGAEEPVRVVFDEPRAGRPRRGGECGEVHGDTGVVHDDDGACARRHEPRDVGGVDVERVGTTVGKDGRGAKIGRAHV